MFKEIKTTVLDVGVTYACVSFIIKAAYRIGKIVGKAEVAERKHRNKTVKNVHTESAEEL